MTLAACSSGEPLEFADWLLPVPDGTPIHEYAPVPIEGRDPEAVQMIEDLVIGADLSSPAAIVYEPGSIVVAPDGSIFVADGSTVDVKMFSPEGAYLKTLGQEGQGPREFGRVSQMTIAGDHLVIYDSRNRRFSLWTLEGDHVTENAPETREFLQSVEGLADGTVIATMNDFSEEATNRLAIVQRSTSGEDLGELLSIELPPNPSIDRSDPRGSMQLMIDLMDQPFVQFTVANQESLFASPMREYQVFAMSVDGRIEWALRVAWVRLPYSDYLKASMLESLAGFLDPDGEIAADDLEWKSPYPAVSAVLSDGRGRLHVFPGIPAEGEEPPDSRAVDVYSPDGALIAAGTVPQTWRFARDDYVYATRLEDNDEYVVVRYRLVVNEQ